MLALTSHKSLSFDENRYIHSKEPPPGIQHDLKISLDEFYLFDSDLKVQRVSTGETTVESVHIKTACKSMRKKHAKDASCFTLCLSSNEELNDMINLPHIIREKSFYEKYWPLGYLSNYFKYKNKLFHTYQEGYKSHPYIAYGGMTEWLYIISGIITITLIEPTQLNLCKFSALTEHENFGPQKNTSKDLQLREGHFFVIPAGWITVREANRTTFAFGGEILHQDNLVAQLNSFNSDTNRLGGRFDQTIHDRDAEIRYMYWFYAAHILKIHNSLKQHSEGYIEILKTHLDNWRTKSTKLGKFNDPYFRPTTYAPSGIKVDIIVRDLQSRLNNRAIKRRSQSRSQEL